MKRFWIGIGEVFSSKTNACFRCLRNQGKNNGKNVGHLLKITPLITISIQSSEYGLSIDIYTSVRKVITEKTQGYKVTTKKPSAEGHNFWAKNFSAFRISNFTTTGSVVRGKFHVGSLL